MSRIRTSRIDQMIRELKSIDPEAIRDDHFRKTAITYLETYADRLEEAGIKTLKTVEMNKPLS